MNSLWLVLTALAAFLVAYRFYGAFLATKVAMLNDARITPAHRLRDNVDYHPTRKLVLFGVHFAAIAGSGPLVGPVLAAQWGYCPGFAWIIVGACLAGGVHDFVILLASVRHSGCSLPKIARDLLGPISGIATTAAVLFIIISTLAATGRVVVNDLGGSPWGVFTIAVTIPAALLTGLWMNVIRPGRVGEATIVGMTLVLLGVVLGKPFADSAWAHYLAFSPGQLAIILPVYAAIASILPVWVLLCPRDYLSSYMKIGVIVMLAVGILLVAPMLKMPATTPFVDGSGPVVPGSVWPFVCIVIMCGALSGFHSLVSSGTTPKMVNRETDIRAIGYGAMLLEGFVAVMALVAACTLEPGEYFRINTSLDAAGQTSRYDRAVAKTSAERGWDIGVSSEQFAALEKSIGGEKLSGRASGGVTLGVGMSKVFAKLPGMKQLTDYWYHFVIMFEVLFILTLLETGTRIARFIFQEVVTQFFPGFSPGNKPHWGLNVAMSLLVCFLWGYLVYSGDLGSLWRMMGIANQLLAVIALGVGTTYLLRQAPKRIYALCTAVPWLFAVVTVFTAGVASIGSWARELGAEGITPAAAFWVKLLCALAGVMLLLTAIMTVDAMRRWWQILGSPRAASLAPAPAELDA